jgi:hypothetical protein
MSDTRVTKQLDGVYKVADRMYVTRDGARWLAGGEAYPTFRLARLAALILTGVATDAECETFRQGQAK